MVGIDQGGPIKNPLEIIAPPDSITVAQYQAVGAAEVPDAVDIAGIGGSAVDDEVSLPPSPNNSSEPAPPSSVSLPAPNFG